MLRGKALIGASAVILGIAAIPAVSDSAAGIAHHAQCPSKASKSKHAKQGKRSGACQEPSPTVALQIVWYPFDFVPLTYSLNCDPISGTLIDPSAACAEIARNPSMLAAPTEAEGEDCEDRDASVSVTGVYDQQKVAGGSSCSSLGSLAALPAERRTARTGQPGPWDRGFHAWQKRIGCTGFIGRQLPRTAGGLDVYEPTGGLPGLEAVECRKDSDTLIMAFRYKRTSGLVTMMANLPELALGGEAWGTQQVETRMRRRRRSGGTRSASQLGSTTRQLASCHLRGPGSPR